MTGTDAIPMLDLVATMARATMAYPFKRWGFGESIAMEALLAAGGEPGDWAAATIAEWAADHAPFAGDPLAHVAPGVPLLTLHERAGRSPGNPTNAPFGDTSSEITAETLLACAVELAGVFAQSAVGTHGAQIHRPDLVGWQHEVWVDCMHLDGPFLAHLALVTGEARYAELAGEILLGHARILQDERSGLFSHGFNDATGKPNGVHWGRGEGWALLGLIDTARQLPDGDPARVEAIQRLEALVAGLARHEAEPGAWRTVVNAPETVVEASVGAFVALGVGRAARHGLVDPAYTALAERAWATTLAGISPDGLVLDVSDATPVGNDAAHYDARPRGTFPWGQGPTLLAAIDRLPHSPQRERL